jgi:dTDP-4-dehydrorhamnose reductase
MKVLILGGTGMLGHMAGRVLPSRFEVSATSKSPLDDSNPMLRFLPKSACIGGLDVEDRPKLREVIARVRPDAILNCVGIIKQKKEAHDAIPSVRINSLFPHELSAIASDLGAKVIHLSTDCVFSGKRGRYTEDDIPDPVDLYGRSKLLGEVSEAPHLTVRTSIIGRELGATTSGLVEWFISQRGKKIQGYAKAIYTGFTTHAFCQLLIAVLEKRRELSGVHHLASQPISKYELLSRLNGPLGLGITIEKNETFDCDRSLDASRFIHQTQIPIPSWDQMLGQLIEDAKNYDAWRR